MRRAAAAAGFSTNSDTRRTRGATGRPTGRMYPNPVSGRRAGIPIVSSAPLRAAIRAASRMAERNTPTGATKWSEGRTTMTPSAHRDRIQRAAVATAAAVFRPISSSTIRSVATSGAWRRTHLRCAAPATTRTRSGPDTGAIRSYVRRNVLFPRNRGRNGLGLSPPVSGQRRVPEPPARITAKVGGIMSVEKSIADDAGDGREPVLPGDLLPGLVPAAMIRNGDLVDSAAEMGDLGGELRLETKSIRFQDETLEHAGSKRLVARLHVRQVQVREHVREHRQEAIADIVPEEQHAMRLPSEPRAVYHVGLAIQDGLEEPRVIGRVVLQVGVLHQHDIARHPFKSGAQSRPLALVPVLEQDDHARAGLGPQNLPRPVRRPVIDHDDLFLRRLRQNPAEDFVDGARFVVDGNDDRKLHSANQATVRRRPSSSPIRGSYCRWRRASSMAAREWRTSPGRGLSCTGRISEPTTRPRTASRSRRVALAPQATLKARPAAALGASQAFRFACTALST